MTSQLARLAAAAGAERAGDERHQPVMLSLFGGGIFEGEEMRDAAATGKHRLAVENPVPLFEPGAHEPMRAVRPVGDVLDRKSVV